MVIAIRDEPGFSVAASNLPLIQLTGLSYDDCAELARRQHITILPEGLRSLVGAQRRQSSRHLRREPSVDGSPGLAFRRRAKLVLPSLSLDRLRSQVLSELRQLPTQRALVLWWLASLGAGSADLGAALGEVGLSLRSLQPAERQGLVLAADDGVRLCHPLLRSVVLDRIPLADRVQVYQALARIHDGSLRAWYLAAAATGPDEAAADALIAAAADARRRSGYGASASARGAGRA